MTQTITWSGMMNHQCRCFPMWRRIMPDGCWPTGATTTTVKSSKVEPQPSLAVSLNKALADQDKVTSRWASKWS